MTEPSPRDMLARIPDMAAEAYLTWDAPNPNPGERSDKTGRRSHVHQPAPTNLSTLVALDPLHGLLPTITECVRIIWEQMPAPDRPPLQHPPTWSGETGWLLATVTWWQSHLDECDLGWVEDAIAAAYRELARLTREPEDKPVLCGRCRIGALEQVHDAMWECHACGHTVTVRAVTLKQAAAEVDVPLRTLQDWANRPGLLRPILDGGPRTRLFDLGDIRRVAAEKRLREGA